jgi:hypothetical protein
MCSPIGSEMWICMTYKQGRTNDVKTMRAVKRVDHGGRRAIKNK